MHNHRSWLVAIALGGAAHASLPLIEERIAKLKPTLVAARATLAREESGK